jgi:hypothetical protein
VCVCGGGVQWVDGFVGACGRACVCVRVCVHVYVGGEGGCACVHAHGCMCVHASVNVLMRVNATVP